ncbi:hypothetical protein [Aeoliella mucimassa]|uniref:Uncharacterized protein n=1 Tax=Aeoliella mucimassa TaxID=2527972 RepID=A0A518AIP3_9BACT|nr:hypothetical protein [Aeoliella mucimassa]QDU54570.1 hypothetical protein Pan181_07530 [Aeoliella mucimassa]
MSHPTRIYLFSSLVVAIVSAGCNDPNSSLQQSTGANNLPPGVAQQLANIEKANAAVSDEVDQLFRDIQAEKIKQIYEQTLSPKFREVATLEEFETITERLRTRLGALQSKTISTSEVNPYEGTLVASANYEATFEKGAGSLLVSFEQQGDEWQLLRLRVNAPQLLDDPSTFRQPTELFVDNSEPVMPGAMVDLVDKTVDPPKVVLENVQVLNVRWKVSGPSSKPTAPASGFVTVGLKPEEASTIKSIDSLSVAPHQ